MINLAKRHRVLIIEPWSIEGMGNALSAENWTKIAIEE